VAKAGVPNLKRVLIRTAPSTAAQSMARSSGVTVAWERVDHSAHVTSKHEECLPMSP